MIKYLPLLALVGCSSLPEATSQIRLSQVQAAAEGGTVGFGGGLGGSACVLSVVGKLPEGITADLKQGTCEAKINARE